MADRGLIPDDIIFIDDSGDQSVLPKRWFTKNRHIIVERVRDECEKKKVVEKARREKSRREREVITKRLLEINEKRKELQAKQDGDTQDGDKDSKDGGAGKVKFLYLSIASRKSKAIRKVT